MAEMLLVFFKYSLSKNPGASRGFFCQRIKAAPAIKEAENRLRIFSTLSTKKQNTQVFQRESEKNTYTYIKPLPRKD